MLLEQVLASLLDNDILNEDTKQQLEEAVKTQLAEAVEQAKADAEIEIRAELTKEFLEEKAQLVEALDTKAEEYLAKEIGELKEDIDRFRDLEVEYAERLTEHKQVMAETLKGDLEELVEALDVFIEMQLRSELKEFEDSIEEVKKIKTGQQIFEQFEQIYLSKHAGTDSEAKTMAKLEEAESKLNEKESQLEKAEANLNAVLREQKMHEVLQDLNGQTKEVMQAILKSVPTEQLDEAYKNFIPRVLHESATQKVENAEKEEEVLAESSESTKEDDDTVMVTGDSPVVESVEDESEDADKITLSESDKRNLQKLAGLID